MNVLSYGYSLLKAEFLRASNSVGQNQESYSSDKMLGNPSHFLWRLHVH